MLIRCAAESIASDADLANDPVQHDASGLGDLGDLGVLFMAWLTTPSDAAWNRACDISEPVDNIIDTADARILGENWLQGF